MWLPRWLQVFMLAMVVVGLHSRNVRGQVAESSVNRAETTREASGDDPALIAALEARPIKVELAPGGLWVKSITTFMVGDQLRPRPDGDHPVQIADFELIAKLKRVETLSICHIHVSLAELDKVRDFPSLRSLTVAPSQIGPSEICDEAGYL